MTAIPFSPEQIADLEIWMDASDASTVTTVDDAGTPRVSAWANKAHDGAARSFIHGLETLERSAVAGKKNDGDAA